MLPMFHLHFFKGLQVTFLWHVLKPETTKRNGRNETTETTETSETSETKPPKQPKQAKRPKRAKLKVNK